MALIVGVLFAPTAFAAETGSCEHLLPESIAKRRCQRDLLQESFGQRRGNAQDAFKLRMKNANRNRTEKRNEARKSFRQTNWKLRNPGQRMQDRNQKQKEERRRLLEQKRLDFEKIQSERLDARKALQDEWKAKLKQSKLSRGELQKAKQGIKAKGRDTSRTERMKKKAERLKQTHGRYRKRGPYLRDSN